MKKEILKHLKKTQEQEAKFISKRSSRLYKEKVDPALASLEEKIPAKLRETLEVAFYKGFLLVFEKGTAYIEKFFDKEHVKLEHEARNYIVDKVANRKTIRSLDDISRQSRFKNQSIASVEGAGLGLLGIGLPDIPLFIAVILKSLYEVALSYGFDYDDEAEQMYMLLIISAATAPDGQRAYYSRLADELADSIDNRSVAELDREHIIQETAGMLSNAMLVAKFIQGLPIVGVVGGITNYTTIGKIGKLATITYKKRYLHKKLISE